jgi:hypothetical protein
MVATTVIREGFITQLQNPSHESQTMFEILFIMRELFSFSPGFRLGSDGTVDENRLNGFEDYVGTNDW